MSLAKEMLDAYPGPVDVERSLLGEAIGVLFACAQACTASADACLAADQHRELIVCIRLNLDCADVCLATGRMLSRQTTYDINLARSLLVACAQACTSCGDECERHATTWEHCRLCADACRRGQEACRRLLEVIPSPST